MNYVNAGHHLEQLSRYMWCGAVAGTCHAEPAGIGLGVGNEVGNGLCRKRWRHFKGECLATNACDRRDIADEIVVELVVECRIDCTLNGDQQQRMPISGSLDDRLDGEIAAAPRPVLDDERLAEPLRQPSGYQTPQNVR